MGNRKTHSHSLAGSLSRREMLVAGGLLIPASAVLPGFFRSAFAATTFDYYISPSGSDSNPGTSTQPWAITALNTKRSTYSGKTVGLLDGTYNVDGLLAGKDSVDQWALDVAGGTSAAPTTVKAVNARKAVISVTNHNAGGTPVIGHSGGTGQRGYVTLDGIKITGAKRLGVRMGIFGVGPQIPGVAVKNCEFTNFNGSSLGAGLNLEQIEINQCTGYRIQNNYFHDNIGYSATDAGHFSSLLVWRSDRGIVEFNTIVKSGGLYGKVDGNYGTTLRYNYVDVSHLSTGICIQDFAGTTSDKGADTAIYNNVLIGAQAIVLLETLSDAGYIPTRVAIYNNTCIVKNSLASRGIQFKTDSGLATVYNNIVHTAGTNDHTMLAVNVDGPTVLDYNCYYSSTSDPRWSTYSSKTATSRNTVGTMSALQTVLGAVSSLLNTIENSSVSGRDPLFVGTGVDAQRYKLQSGSPCKSIGRVGGVSSGAVTEAGAWGNGATVIGSDLSVVAQTAPVAPALSVE